MGPAIAFLVVVLNLYISNYDNRYNDLQLNEVVAPGGTTAALKVLLNGTNNEQKLMTVGADSGKGG
jgi:hypothetical protein